ncbi:MAG: hypothetical protein K8F54_10035 [Altibacter sp.]|uniref:hypothetical protein n=1 Tax=Altibacter sp. TaxID=2024823 RepID=UPI001D2F8092|nr:hypothetical protein [Altibacter sp.]MBZ0327931.1 hypothetical protein [Altibacter sp.]
MENKTAKYVKYAIGEIVLVVVGILIALQLNTWNTQRIQNNELKDTCERMLQEIASTKKWVAGKSNFIDSVVVSSNKRSLYLMQLKDPDSIRQIYNSLEGLSKVISVANDMPTTSEFLNDRNISELKNVRLKEHLLQIKQLLKFGAVVEGYANTQLSGIIEPFVVKNLNYAKMARDKDMVEINSPTDYSFFFNNLELENLINLKLETDHSKIDYLLTFNAVLDRTENEIKNELQKYQ